MRIANIYFVLFFVATFCNAQNTYTFITKESLLYSLEPSDSIFYYQCHVEEVKEQIQTANGQTLTTQSKKITLTDKFVVYKTDSTYKVNYYVASLTVFPNRKFSGLKIREKKYWQFVKQKSKTLTEKDLKYFIALEKSGQPTTEYDFAITKYTTNQLIIKCKKDFKQLLIKGGYVLSSLVMTAN